MGQGASDSSPVLNFYSDSDGSNPIYNLGPEGMVKDSEKYTPASWTEQYMYYSSSQFHTNYLLSQYANSMKSIYYFEDAYRFVRSGANSSIYVLQYVNPFAEGGYSSTHSPLHQKYFKAVQTPTASNYYSNYADAGYYMRTPVSDGTNIVAEIYQISNASSGDPKLQTITEYRATFSEVWNDGVLVDYKIQSITSV